MSKSVHETRICLACNEDGYGPSAFGFYIAGELIRAWRERGQGLRLTVLNTSAALFNRSLYSDSAVEVQPVDSLIKFRKAKGEIHVPETLNLLRQYGSRRASYLADVRQWLEACDVAIDIGVPLFTRAAHQLGVAHRVTVFDHSWATTSRLIASEEWQHLYQNTPVPGPDERTLAEEIAVQIEEDEIQATDIFLFEDYIAPQEFVDHWKKFLIQGSPRFIPGVFGGPVTLNEARIKLEATLLEYGQERNPIPAGKRLVLVSPGGTPVWDHKLPELLCQVLDAPEQEYVLFVAKDLRPILELHPELRERIHRSDRIRYFGPLRGATQQAILPAFDRIVGRAGGGTVNDALATGVPFVLVEEPQVQIKLIERECVQLGLTGRAASLVEFAANPKACIDRLLRMSLPQPKVVPQRNAETVIVEHIRRRVFGEATADPPPRANSS